MVGVGGSVCAVCCVLCAVCLGGGGAVGVERVGWGCRGVERVGWAWGRRGWGGVGVGRRVGARGYGVGVTVSCGRVEWSGVWTPTI
jgi:hypothetical protein